MIYFGNSTSVQIRGRSLFDFTSPYMVDFEGQNETKNVYSEATLKLNGINWRVGPEALIGTTSSDIKNGNRAARLRAFGGIFGSLTMAEDLKYGCSSIRFLYSRSNFTDDRVGTSPSFIVEYSVDQGLTWVQAGNIISLSGINSLTEFNTNLNVKGLVRIRIRQVSGANEKRWNVDNIVITNNF
jgi:hypothetical protein